MESAGCAASPVAWPAALLVPSPVPTPKWLESMAAGHVVRVLCPRRRRAVSQSAGSVSQSAGSVSQIGGPVSHLAPGQVPYRGTRRRLAGWSGGTPVVAGAGTHTPERERVERGHALALAGLMAWAGGPGRPHTGAPRLPLGHGPEPATPTRQPGPGAAQTGRPRHRRLPPEGRSSHRLGAPDPAASRQCRMGPGSPPPGLGTSITPCFCS